MTHLKRKALIIEMKKKFTKSEQIGLVKNLAGSVKISKKLLVKDIDEIIEEAKKLYFARPR